jgi:pimeloyl-ACP methyl ester carboxylesterase
VYSISNALADTGATMAWLRLPENVTRYRIDTDKLVIAGHSTGAYNAARHAAADPALLGAILLDAWNATGVAPRDRKEQAQTLRTGPQSLVLQSPESYVEDYWTHAPLLEFAPKLAAMPLLMAGADKANGPKHKVLAEAIEKAGNKQVESINLPTGHAFDDHRVTVANLMLHWLDKLAARPR